VLNRIASTIQRPMQSDPAVSVASNFFLLAVCFIRDRPAILRWSA